MRLVALLCSVGILFAEVGAVGFAAARSSAPDAPPAPHEFDGTPPDASYGRFGANMRIVREEQLATEYRTLILALASNRVILWHFVKTLQEGTKMSGDQKDQLFELVAVSQAQSLRASRLLTKLRGAIEARVLRHCTPKTAPTTACLRAERDARAWQKETPDAFAQHGIVFGYAQTLKRLLAIRNEVARGSAR